MCLFLFLIEYFITFDKGLGRVVHICTPRYSKAVIKKFDTSPGKKFETLS
jgi:hypothetical protein